MGALELKVPPPALALIAGLIMWFVASPPTSVDVPFGVRVGVAVAIACIGLVIGCAGMVAFWKAKTTMNPIKPGAASSLVTGGVFRLTRNPMYLSLLFYLLAWAVYLSSWLALVVLPFFVLYIDRFQIRPEERALSSIFGPEYAVYKGKVRRWL